MAEQSSYHSVRARRPSPSTINPAVIRMSAAPGKNNIHHWPETIKGLPALIMTSHSGVDGWILTPKKLNPAACRIAQEIFVVDCVMSGERELGSRWRNIKRVCAPPMARAVTAGGVSCDPDQKSPSVGELEPGIGLGHRHKRHPR